MERLTSYKSVCKREMICRHEECDTCKEYCPYMNEDNCPCLQEVLEKLAAYEDIGLKPEQLREIDKLYAEKCKELAELEKKSFSGIEMVKIWENLQKIKEYQKLEEQGKLLKLPCAKGDWVYKIKDGRVNYYKVVKIEVEESGVYFKSSLDPKKWPFCTLDDFGKTVFLTEEAAEAALKEMSE